jgi:hypothetical protein
VPEEVAGELSAGGLAARETDANLPEQFVVVGMPP